MPTNEWKDIDTKAYDCGYGKFVEVSLRTNGNTKGLSIANGSFAMDKEGNSDKSRKVYRNRVFMSMNDGISAWLQATIKEMATKL